MRTFAFRNRLFFIYAAVIVAVVVLFSAVLLITTVNASRDAELYHQQEIYKKNLLEVEGIFRQMDRIASQIASNNEILGCFIPLAAGGNAGNYFAQNLIDSIRISSLLSSINGTDRYAARISVFNGHGDYISTGTLYETPEVIAETLASDYDAIKARVMQQGVDGVVLGFHADRWSDNAERRLISLYRALASFTATIYGIVDIQVSEDVLAAYGFWGEDAEYLLIDRGGHIVYPAASSAWAEGTGAQLAGLIREVDQSEDDMAVVHATAEGQRVILMGASLRPSDWVLVRVLPQGALLAPYARSIFITALACLILLACLVLVMYYLALHIARPLQSLSAAVAGVNLQNMRQSIERKAFEATTTKVAYATAELDSLNQAFQAMLERLDRSIAMELQAHMRALQSQMNPHFLFNMLSVIVESCEERGVDVTVEMCLKLSSMLRYIADFGGDSATLAEEVEHTRNYLDLMRSRYEDTFSYEIVTEGPIEEAQVPKVIMQPLAENCFAHGFRDCRPPWHIRVEARAEGQRWSLSVADNGVGITEETVASIYGQVERYRSDVATNYENLRLGGIGLVNTLLRLSLAQGEGICFSIGNNPGQGTVVQIGVPP